MTVLGNVSNTTMTHTNNANAEIVIKAHPTSGTDYYEARLGFSSNGSIYHMPVNSSTWERVLTATNTAAGTNNAATLTWSTTYTIAKINGTDIKFTTMTKPTAADIGAAPAVTGGYLPLSGGNMTGKIYSSAARKLQWTTSDNDNNADGASWYGLGGFNVEETSGDSTVTRQWICLSNYWGLSFRARDDNHVKINDHIVLNSANYTNYTVTKTGSGASGSWGISITGSAASLESKSETGNYARPIWFSQHDGTNVVNTKLGYNANFTYNPSTRNLNFTDNATITVAAAKTLGINTTTGALTLSSTTGATTISTTNGALEAKSTGSGTVKLTGATGAMTISTTTGVITMQTNGTSGGDIIIKNANAGTISIQSAKSSISLAAATTMSITSTTSTSIAATTTMSISSGSG